MRVFALLALLLIGCGTTTTAQRGLPPLETVPRVDLQRYLGTWYEIATIPQSFQRGCVGTTATYSLRDDGVINVVNRCRIGTLAGEEKVATGRARVVDKSSNSKLEVSFFGPFWGEYWIIELEPDYRYAVVGHPSRDSLWILSRTPTMDEAQYDQIVSRLKGAGYAVERLVRTPQPSDAQSAR
jgi:apolipoprotein D and lipocalin family protein